MSLFARRKKLATIVILVAACASATLVATAKPKKAQVAQMDDSKRAQHA